METNKIKKNPCCYMCQDSDFSCWNPQCECHKKYRKAKQMRYYFSSKKIGDIKENG